MKKQWTFLRTPKMPLALPKVQSDFRVVVIGDSPYEQDDENGYPFSSRSAKLLRDAMPGNWVNQVYWTNTIKCKLGDRGPTDLERSCCSDHLDKDLVKIKPHAILGVGKEILHYFWPGQSVQNVRGIPFPVQLKDGSWCWFMSTYDPLYVIRAERKNYQDKTVSNATLPVFKADIKKFFNRVPEFVTPPSILTPPKVDDVLYPKNMQEALNIAERFTSIPAIDFETLKLKPYMRDARILTGALSDGKTTMAFPINWIGDLNPWGTEFLRKLFTKDPRWIAQKGGFELIWVISKIFDNDVKQTYIQRFEDTQILGRLVNRRSKLGSLAALSRLYLGFNVKALSTIGAKRVSDYSCYQGDPQDKVLYYNSLDSWGEWHVWDKLITMLTPDDEVNYLDILDAERSVTAMEFTGLHVNLDASAKLQKQFREKANAYQKQALKYPEVRQFEKDEGKPFLLSAPESIAKIITTYLGFELPYNETTKRYSTDEQFLTPLIGKHPFIDLTLDAREVNKLLSTYIEPVLSGAVLGVDRLLHAAYTTVHTSTYRLSSEDPNIQNWPKRKNKEIRGQVVARPGHILVAYDYGQLEARVVAMGSKCPGLTKALLQLKEVDLHWKWLDKCLEKYPAYIDRLAKKSGETELGKIRKAGRTIIKTDFVFASLYGSQAPAISNRTEIPLPIVTEILADFWGEYYQAKIWIDEQFAFYQKYGYVQSLTGRIRDEVLPGNEVINTPSQGTAAEIVLKAQNALYKMAMETGDLYYLPRINIHDDLVFELPDDERLGGYVETIGREVVKPRFPFITVALVSECRVGYDWANLEAINIFEGEYFGMSKLQQGA